MTPSAPNGTYDYAYNGANSSNAAVSLAINTAQYHSVADLINYVNDPWGIFLQPAPLLSQIPGSIAASGGISCGARLLTGVGC